MNQETIETMLVMLKTDLGITADAYNVRLAQYLRSAETQITREGITLDDDAIDDQQLVVMYAAWMWRKRDFSVKYAGESSAGMPRMLRYALNNRVFSEKVAANG